MELKQNKSNCYKANTLYQHVKNFLQALLNHNCRKGADFVEILRSLFLNLKKILSKQICYISDFLTLYSITALKISLIS